MNSWSVFVRDDQWLRDRLKLLWDLYFFDTQIVYPITIKFGPSARSRFGSIRAVKKQSLILINGLFKHPDLPEVVIDGTIVHELAHYAHGFGSGLPKKYQHPHRGGVIGSELASRNCQHLEARADQWREANWTTFYERQMSANLRAANTNRVIDTSLWDTYLELPGYRDRSELEATMKRLVTLFGIETDLKVDWLKASKRRAGLSYKYPKEGMIRIHGLLADPRTPLYLIEHELSYWLLTECGVRGWARIELVLKRFGLWENAQLAVQWRRKSWDKYVSTAHPLRTV